MADKKNSKIKYWRIYVNKFSKNIRGQTLSVQCNGKNITIFIYKLQTIHRYLKYQMQRTVLVFIKNKFYSTIKWRVGNDQKSFFNPLVPDFLNTILFLIVANGVK